MSEQTHEVLCEVATERGRQDSKWGEQNHSPAQWMTILAEEFGEAAKEACDAEFPKPWGDPQAKLRAELVQTAAVAVAFVECLDRNVPARLVVDRLFHYIHRVAVREWAEKVAEKYPNFMSGHD